MLAVVPMSFQASDTDHGWLWRELNYSVAAETLQDMELHRIDLPFAIKYFKNVVHELNLVIELRNDLAVSVSHPEKPTVQPGRGRECGSER